MSPGDRARSGAIDAVLVGGIGLDHRAGMALRLLGDGAGKLSLNPAWSSGPAARAWRGRGRWIVQPIARSACPAALLGHRSQPELGCHDGRDLPRAPDPAVVGWGSAPARAAARAPQGSGPSPSPRRPGGGRPARTARRRCSERAALPPSAARSSSAARSQRRCAPLRQQPDHLVVPRQRRVPAAAIPRPQLRHAQMTHNPCHARPPETTE